jgi:hypothetical protein
MMVITQTCDVVKPANELPQVEVARVFTTNNERLVAQAQDFGSARFFRLNDPAHDEAVVLDYGLRALLDKGFLTAAKPDNTLREAWFENEGKKLARWLGQRYSRPAISDEAYIQVTRPVRDAWKRLIEEEPETASSFNREYAEWRYRREADGSLTIYILSPQPEPDDLVALEVIDFLTQAIEPGYPAQVRVASDHRSYHTFTKADELSTEQISMEWASHEEGVEDAILPE